MEGTQGLPLTGNAILLSRDRRLLRAIGKTLEPLGLKVVESSPSDVSFRQIQTGRPSLLIVDGRDYLASISDVPWPDGHIPPTLLLLQEEALPGLRAPLRADEVMVLPLRPEELRLRVRQLLGRRVYGRGGGPSPPPSGAGVLSVDADRYEITLDGTPLELTYLEFELLKYLMTHPGRTLTREHLLNQVWGQDYLGGTRTVDVHVRRLRAKLERGNREFIKTVRGVGYRFLT